MRAPRVVLVLLAVGFVAYVVADQVARHAARTPPADPAVRKPTAPTRAARPDGDGLRLPPDEAPTSPGPRARAPGVEHWVDRLRNGSESERFDAIVRLGELGDAAAIPHLAAVLATHRDFYLRLASATALGQIGDWAATPALASALLDADELVRTAANEALSRITGHRIQGVEAADGVERRAARKAAWDAWLAANRPSDK